MGRLILFLFSIAAIAGCESLSTPKVDNPVVGPPPPRVSKTKPGKPRSNDLLADKYVNDPLDPAVDGFQPGEVVPTAAESESIEQTGAKPAGHSEGRVDGELFGSQTVALVNGEPIFASEVLERYGVPLEKAGRELSPEQFRKAKLALVRRDLRGHIERKLLVQALTADLQKEQIEALNGFIDSEFAKEVQRLKQEFDVTSTHELENELAKQRTSLANLRNAFANQRMAMEFLGAKSQTPEIGRPEMLRYYEEHKQEDYFKPAEVRWQQILVSYNKNGGKRGAIHKMEAAIDELRRQADFSDVARRFSDGPAADKGGDWGWTQPGSLNNDEINKALEQLPVDTPSQVFEDNVGFHIIQVNAVREEEYVPFDDVQDEIKAKLQRQARQKATKKVVAELQKGTDVITIFDRTEDGQAALPLGL